LASPSEPLGRNELALELEGTARPALGLSLRFIDVPIRVLTNDTDVWTRLSLYLKPYVTTEDLTPATVVTLIQGHARLEGEFTDIARGPGGPAHEAVQEVEGGRLILRRARGVIMGLWPGRAVAVGDLRANLKEAINLIDACYAKTMLGRGYQLLHAAGVSRGGRGAALAGVPGAGKSTAALHLVEAGFRFLSNDRILARPDPAGVDARGYPKQPQVHPGTLLHHPRLVSLLDPEERRALSALPARELWQLTHGRSRAVDVDALYGPGTVCLQARLELLVLVTWTLDGAGFGVCRLDAESALARWPIYHQDLGVFDLDRAISATPTADDLAACRELVGQLTVVEVSGRPDFAALVDVVGDLMAG
jgi:HprK-related kinase B